MAVNRDSDSHREGSRSSRSRARSNGVLKGGAGKGGPEWWSKRWHSWAQELGLAPASPEDVPGRIKRLEIGPGVVNAVVQERNDEQCQVEIRFTPWSETQWLAAVDAMAEQAIFAAQLLAGELPPELDGLLNEAGAPLLPARANEVAVTCHSPACATGKCRHAAVIFAQLGEALTDDPWMLLRMRGRDQTQVLAALRKVRTKPAESGQTRTPTAPTSAPGRFHRNPAEATAQDDVPPLSAELANFWGVAKNLEGYRPHFNEPKVDAVLLRRLGPLPFSSAEDDIYEDLAAIYRRVTATAMRRAFAAEPAAESVTESLTEVEDDRA